MDRAVVGGKDIEQWIKEYPILENIIAGEEVLWVNPKLTEFKKAMEAAGDPQSITLTREDIQDAEEKLRRFAPFIAKVFPETQSSGGIINFFLFYYVYIIIFISFIFSIN